MSWQERRRPKSKFSGVDRRFPFRELTREESVTIASASRRRIDELIGQMTADEYRELHRVTGRWP